jgi:hypothetical protein
MVPPQRFFELRCNRFMVAEIVFFHYLASKVVVRIRETGSQEWNDFVVNWAKAVAQPRVETVQRLHSAGKVVGSASNAKTLTKQISLCLGSNSRYEKYHIAP